MYPYEDGEGFCYIAHGSWDLNSMISDRRPQEMGRLDLVAGVDEITKMQEE
jgi:hypothetical protein